MNNVSVLLLSFACAAFCLSTSWAWPCRTCAVAFFLLSAPFAEPLPIGAVSAVGPFFRWCCPGRARVALCRTPVSRLGQPGCDVFLGLQCGRASPGWERGRPSVSLFQLQPLFQLQSLTKRPGFPGRLMFPLLPVTVRSGC